MLLFIRRKMLLFSVSIFSRKEEGSNRKPILLFDGRHVPTGFRASTRKKIFDGELLDTTIQSFLTVALDLSELFHEYYLVKCSLRKQRASKTKGCH